MAAVPGVDVAAELRAPGRVVEAHGAADDAHPVLHVAVPLGLAVVAHRAAQVDVAVLAAGDGPDAGGGVVALVGLAGHDVGLPDDGAVVAVEASVLLGAVGGPKWDNQPAANRPERGLLKLREGMGLYTNVRPAKMFSELSAACPLRADIAANGIDLVVVRELIGGVYFGEHRTEEANGEQKATDIMAYSEHEIKRVARVAFETARKRRKRVTSIDKANVLDTSRLWRKTVTEVAKDYPDVELRHMYVDNAAMQLVRDPSQFDVIVTENLFGDILSDEASQITGSIGMIPSSSMGDGTNGLYEPIHGSAPDIAGQDKANPIGTILAAAMMLRYSFDMAAEADAIERAVDKTLRSGFRCGDIMQENCQLVGCKAMGAEIRSRI